MSTANLADVIRGLVCPCGRWKIDHARGVLGQCNGCDCPEFGRPDPAGSAPSVPGEAAADEWCECGEAGCGFPDHDYTNEPQPPSGAEQAVESIRQFLGMEKSTAPSRIAAATLLRLADSLNAPHMRWRREVAELVGVQAEGSSDSTLLARLKALVSSPATAETPEVVTEAEAARLPERSKFVACDEYGMPFGGATVNSIGGHRSPRSVGGHALILYRAPEPSKPLAVGDPVKSAEGLEALPLGAIVQEYYGVVGHRRIDGEWQWTARGETDEMRWPGFVRYLPETGGQS